MKRKDPAGNRGNRGRGKWRQKTKEGNNERRKERGKGKGLRKGIDVSRKNRRQHRCFSKCLLLSRTMRVGGEVGVGEALLGVLGVAEEVLAEVVANEAGRGADRVDADRVVEPRGNERCRGGLRD